MGLLVQAILLLPASVLLVADHAALEAVLVFGAGELSASPDRWCLAHAVVTVNAAVFNVVYVEAGPVRTMVLAL